MHEFQDQNNSMLKRILVLVVPIILLIGTTASFAQSKEVQFYIDTCITIMKKNAVNSPQVDWAALKASIQKEAAGINDMYQLGTVIKHLYQALNDFHGAFYYKDSVFGWHRQRHAISDSIMNEWKKGVTNKARVLENNIGYLRIPSMPYNGKEGVDKKATLLNDSLCWLLSHQVKGIIIDARLDGGGAMFPMILGLKQLLPEGKQGSFTAKTGETWYIKGNDFLLDTNILTSLQHTCNMDAQQVPVVILIGPGTGSSGEFFIMPFKTRPHTLLMGTETAGYITSVAGFPINDAAQINLSTGYGADKNGNVYKQALQPDIILTGEDSFNNLAKDLKVKAAVKWLMQQLSL